jgi:hypothetical protein
MKKQLILASILCGAQAFAAVTAEQRMAKRQATFNYWKTVKTCLAAQGYAEDSPEMIRTNRNLHRAENRLTTLGSFYEPRSARPKREGEAPRHAKKARKGRKHVRGSKKEASTKAKPAATKAAPNKEGWLSRTYHKAKAEAEKLV